MQFGILGPLQVRRTGGEPLRLVGQRQRKILATLLLSPNSTVDLHRLIDAVWDDRPPKTAKRQLQNCVSALRRALINGGAAEPIIIANGSGYLVRIGPQQLDAELFRELVGQGHALVSAGRAGPAVDAFRAALRLWRGPALAGLDGRGIRAWATRLDEDRLATLECCVDLELGLGRHHDLVSLLTEVVGSHPLREPMVGQLMIALQRSGRRADALGEYQRLRVRLADDLGVDPGPELQQLYAAILRDDTPVWTGTGLAHLPTGRAGDQPDGAETELMPRRNHLPRAVADFTGRGGDVAELVAGLTGAVPGGSVTAISGKAGIGKTALAVHVGHRLCRQFPDGQLFVNLGGMSGRPVRPDEALLRTLLLLGLPPAQIPRQTQARVELYRTQSATQRLLCVLDDAADEAQVRPFLPAGAGSAIVITSRRPLAGLEAAHHMSLSELDHDEAVELLARVAGAGRVASQPHAARRLVELCGRLPLAVRIAGAKLAVKPHWAVADLADRLMNEQRRLDELQAGDLAVRASFSLSYRALDPDSRQLFATVGLLNGVDFPAWVPATMTGRPIREVQDILERLVDWQLLDATRRDPAGRHRYRMHDLLTIFARECMRHSEPAIDKQAGLGWVVGAWLNVVDSMEARLGLRGTSGIRTAVGATTAYPVGWLPAQRAALTASAAESPDAVWDIGWAITATLVAMSFELWSQWDDWRMTREVALIAGRRVGDRIAPSGEFAVILGQVRPWTEVVAGLERSQSIFDELGDLHWHAATTVSLGNLYRAQARFDLAASTLRRAAASCRELGHPGWEAASLFSLGSLHVIDGRLADAVARYRDCLAIFSKPGDRLWHAHVQRSLGYAYEQHGRFDLAVRALNECLPVLREQDDQMWEAHTLLTLGRAELGRRRLDDATTYLKTCLPLFERNGDIRSHAIALRALAAARGRDDAGTALASLHTCLQLFRQLGDPVGVAHTLYDLATFQRAHGRPGEACGYYRSCRALFHDLGLARWEARTLQMSDS